MQSTQYFWSRPQQLKNLCVEKKFGRIVAGCNEVVWLQSYTSMQGDATDAIEMKSQTYSIRNIGSCSTSGWRKLIKPVSIGGEFEGGRFVLAELTDMQLCLFSPSTNEYPTRTTLVMHWLQLYDTIQLRFNCRSNIIRCPTNAIQPPFDSHSTAIRPRYDNSTTHILRPYGAIENRLYYYYYYKIHTFFIPGVLVELS